jgi:hypothetical protein
VRDGFARQKKGLTTESQIHRVRKEEAKERSNEITTRGAAN